MKILIPISKKYKNLLPAHLYLFKKYWKDHPEIVFLTYQDTSRQLGDKISLLNISNDDVPAGAWSLMILFYLENYYTDKNILLYLDDTLLVREVNNEKINKCLGLINNKIAQKIYLVGSLVNIQGCSHYGKDLHGVSGMVKISTSSSWRNSTQPCIWDVETFKTELKKFQSTDPWNFEECNLDKTTDIYSFEFDRPMMVSHVYRRGNLIPDWYCAMDGLNEHSKLDEEDIAYIRNFL